MNGKLDMDVMLNKAEGIFYQIKDAEHLNDNIRIILGLPILGHNYSFEKQESSSPLLDSNDISNGSAPSGSADTEEEAFERGLNLNFG